MEFQKFLLEDFVIYQGKIQGGSQGYVQKGSHTVHGEVAIKRYRRTYCEREIDILLQTASHDNIVKFIGILIDAESNRIGYIMPYMSMGSLDKHLKFVYLSVIHNTDKNYDDIYTSEQITSWITQICLGLSYLHSKNIIHRDIKPENVLLGKSYDDVKLSDFGISRSIENIAHNLTTGIGTQFYMAPEVSKTANYNISADIYSLSITVWEILHRRFPFDHITTQRHELSTKIINGERPELGNDLSKEVADLLESCWDADVLRRPKINDVLEFSKNRGFQLPEKQTVLLVGGNDGNKLLDSLVVLQNNGKHKESWKKMDIKLPYQVWKHGAQFLKNSLYMFGGRNAKDEILSFTYKLSHKLKWEKVADMNQRREGISNSNLILNDTIWVLGGGSEKEILKSVEMYDPSRNEWKYMKEMNECRTQAAAAVVNGKIFCCGGHNGEKFLNSTECYDPSSDVWAFISDMPLPLRELGAVAMDQNLIVMGGWNGKESLRNVWELNTSDTNSLWTEKTSMFDPRSFFSITKIDDKIFICGGCYNNWIAASVEMFDGEIWKKGPHLTNPRYGAASTVIPINLGKYLEYGITRFGCTETKPNTTYLCGTNETLTVKDINIEKETLLLLGGYNGEQFLDTLIMLQKNEENWKELNIKLPYPIQRHGAQFLNNSLYIFGGQNGKEVLNSTYKLSMNFQWLTLSRRLKWEKMVDMNDKRSYISSVNVILNGKIWVLGGGSEKEILKSVEMYDPSRNEWKYMKEMNECRTQAAAAVVNGKIFCCGGSNERKLLNSTECYNPSSDVWTFISNIPLPLQGIGAVAMDRNLIVIGGCNHTGESGSVWVLDTSNTNAKWIEKSSMSLPRRAFSIAKIDGKIIVCGGDSQEDKIADVEIFDGEAWMNGPKLPIPRVAAAAIVVPQNFAEYLK